MQKTDLNFLFKEDNIKQKIRNFVEIIGDNDIIIIENKILSLMN